jgi:hypothetical protein
MRWPGSKGEGALGNTKWMLIGFQILRECLAHFSNLRRYRDPGVSTDERLGGVVTWAVLPQIGSGLFDLKAILARALAAPAKLASLVYLPSCLSANPLASDSAWRKCVVWSLCPCHVGVVWPIGLGQRGSKRGSG